MTDIATHKIRPDTINAHIANVYPALAMLAGMQLDDSRLSSLDAVAVNVMFLNVYHNGQAYTESEYRSWFNHAGLINIARQELAGGYSIMVGHKPG